MQYIIFVTYSHSTAIIGIKIIEMSICSKKGRWNRGIYIEYQENYYETRSKIFSQYHFFSSIKFFAENDDISAYNLFDYYVGELTSGVLLSGPDGLDRFKEDFSLRFV
ncbi:hypothetical protein NARC_90039 [Candidatus Nitrosocosmicus arcticus]|uniref:Uncharacterized protein n=1 Tax=Candidatus Nitrosocosmicus arcticus TaxID=2035267 RepID=A0A557SU49_9ARCH|nr:hypothetical protein NARC_90039 [Candidatus Nitrosocosmicus arcticus]